ncbi:MAG: hypothetical protein PVJ39_19480 [Gammaproteobacteria bacterium]
MEIESVSCRDYAREIDGRGQAGKLAINLRFVTWGYGVNTVESYKQFIHPAMALMMAIIVAG